MSSATPGIVPVPRHDGDHAAAAVHAHLRSLILQGAIAPGAQLNQMELAPQLGVSRTPVREAIRMLQEEGLVEAQPQKRARVVAFDPEHMETVYAQRILLEGLAATLTARTFTDEALSQLRQRLKELRECASAGDRDGWYEVHRAFHRMLVSNVSPSLARTIASHLDRSEHYRRMTMSSDDTTGRAVADAEHEEIVEAFARRDGEGAAAALSAHLARTALTLVAQRSPAYDPAAIRVALSAYALPERRPVGERAAAGR
jgi:DNA-binding GntR family transcriptional regulator